LLVGRPPFESDKEHTGFTHNLLMRYQFASMLQLGKSPSFTQQRQAALGDARLGEKAAANAEAATVLTARTDTPFCGRMTWLNIFHVCGGSAVRLPP